MRKPTFHSGGKSDSTGCGIFFLFLILMPVLGFFTNILSWIVEYIWIIPIIFIIGFIMLFLKNLKEEE